MKLVLIQTKINKQQVLKNTAHHSVDMTYSESVKNVKQLLFIDNNVQKFLKN